MQTQTSQKETLFARALRVVTPGLFVVSGLLMTYFLFTPVRVAAATSSTINFQARLETNTGAVAADGNYDVTFHLFNAGSSSGSTDTDCGSDTSCEWTESYTYNSGSGSTDARLRVVNGYLTANLGSLTAFPGTVNWNQQQ